MDYERSLAELTFGGIAWPTADVFSNSPLAPQNGESLQSRPRLLEGHIRLVKIHCGDSSSDIRCDTKIFPLCHNKSYTALSYTWGSPLARHPIMLDGRLHLLPKNLWRFLRQAQQLPEYFSGWLWIDVLSIDQTCAWERTHQVLIMSKIFKSAKGVMVWLGPSYAGSDKAMDALSKSKAHLKRNRRLPSLWAGTTGLAIQSLCERPYWRRLWVFQELKFARSTSVMCGDQIVEWDSFKMFLLNESFDGRPLRLRDKLESVKRSPAGTMLNLTQTFLDTTMWGLLQATKHLRCADPHDKVFALLSVAESGHKGIDADYDMPIPILMNHVLRRMHEICPPTSLSEVVSQCESLQELFNLPSEPTNTIFTHHDLVTKDHIRNSSAYRLGPAESHLSVWWTSLYRHAEIQRLLLDAWTYDWFGGTAEPNREAILAAKDILVKCRFNVDTGIPWPHIQTAVVREDLPVLRLLLQMPGINVDVKNEHGESLLHQAMGNPEVLKELLSSGICDHLRRYLHKEPGFWTTIRAMGVHNRSTLLSLTTYDEQTIIKRAIEPNTKLLEAPSQPRMSGFANIKRAFSKH